MSDKMTPIPFENILESLLKEYADKKSFLDVPVLRTPSMTYRNDIGPAAGPHTQLAGNIIAAYAAGASYFELKTVQVLTGDELGIAKPCIYAATEVFNTEWSTELTVEEAKSEYIKAYLLLKVLIKELGLGSPDAFSFIMSVGYDLKGIQNPTVDDFIEHMKDAKTSFEWQKDIAYLKLKLSDFNHITEDYLDNLSPVISDTIALSTMHGCDKDEIEQIAQYLLEEKALNVYVKMNPTLLGKDSIRKILDTLGYVHITFDEAIFDVDINFESACDMIERLNSVSAKTKRIFGVKLTNTFPVKVMRDELHGDTMYLSGPALYPMAIKVAQMLSEKFNGQLPISFSGGADPSNVKAILETGIKPVTVSSYLLKPGGYKNLDKMSKVADEADIPENIDFNKLESLFLSALNAEAYCYKPKLDFSKSEVYSSVCSACNNCVDICPNRANRFAMIDGQKIVVRLESLCNECGACSHYCIKGHNPYKEKLSVVTTLEAFNESDNPSVFWNGACHTKNTSPELDRIIENFNLEEYTL